VTWGQRIYKYTMGKKDRMKERKESMNKTIPMEAKYSMPCRPVPRSSKTL
jgi:hypothetical protein